MNSYYHWVGSWTSPPAPSQVGIGFKNQTLRVMPRVSIGGDLVRIRISNAYGMQNLDIGGVSVGLRDRNASIIEGSEKKVVFGGENQIRIAAGAVVVSDAVRLSVSPLSDLSVSVYLPGEITTSFKITGRYARQTNYISPPGNFLTSVHMPVSKITDEWFFVCGIDVVASRNTGGVVALGDSLTDGNISTHDSYNRWPDQLARRLIARKNGRVVGVMNQGLGGNRILHDIRGDSGLRRFDRDVLAQPGVTHVIVMLGTNDLRNRFGGSKQEVTAKLMIAGIRQMAIRAQSHSIKFIGATLTPFGNETFLPDAWNPKRERHRVALNEWIRKTGELDGVVDFDAALRDPNCPNQMLPIYDCGDGLHPSDLGYGRMGDEIDLSLLD